MSIPFSHSVARIVQQLLIDRGFGIDPEAGFTGTAADWSVYASGEPPTPDNCITVYETTPTIWGKAQTTGQQFAHQGCTIRLRGVDEPTASYKASQLMVQLTEQVYQQDVFLTYTTGGIITTTRYMVSSFPQVSKVPFGTFAPNDKRFLVNLNCKVVIITRPVVT